MNDELTTRLSRQLHEQVDDWHSAPLTLEGVRGRARSIRRRRAALTTGVVAAAVLAVMTPVALTMGNPDAQRPGPAETPTRVVEQQQPSELGVPYLEGRTLTMPDGTELELPRAYDGVVPLGERVLAVRIDTDNGQATLDRVEDGQVVSSEDLAGMGLATNAAGSGVAYVRADGQLVVEGTDGVVELADIGQAQPVRLLGGPDCSTADSCTVFLNTDTAPVMVNGSGEVTDLPGSPLAVADVSETTGRVAVLSSVDELEPSSCSRVVDGLGSGGTVFETCDVSLDEFSPDASYLSAGPSYRSGIGDSTVAIMDGETGKELARFSPENGFIHTSVWEDPEHLLVLTHHWGSRQWAVIRLATDGSIEEALGPEAGGELKPPWKLVRGS